MVPVARGHEDVQANGAIGHGNTCSDHPVSAAFGAEVIRLCGEDGILADMAAPPPYFMQPLIRLSDDLLGGEMRGPGLPAAVKIVSDKAAGTPFETENGISFVLSAATNSRTQGWAIHLGLCRGQLQSRQAGRAVWDDKIARHR